MGKIVNIKIEENATFAKVLEFKKDVVKSSSPNPITGEQIVVTKKEPIDLTGYTISAQIKSSLEDDAALIAILDTQLLDSKKGMAYIGLTKEQTASLDLYAKVDNTGLRSERSYIIGYYDILLTNSTGTATRVLQGKCYFSKAATKDPLLSISSRNTTVTKSPLTSISTPVDLVVDTSKAHYYAGIQYFDGGVQVTPTEGQIEIYRMPNSSNYFQNTPVGLLVAAYPGSEIAWQANTKQVRAIPKNVVGATAYQLVVVSNIS